MGIFAACAVINLYSSSVHKAAYYLQQTNNKLTVLENALSNKHSVQIWRPKINKCLCDLFPWSFCIFRYQNLAATWCSTCLWATGRSFAIRIPWWLPWPLAGFRIEIIRTSTYIIRHCTPSSRKWQRFGSIRFMQWETATWADASLNKIN